MKSIPCNSFTTTMWLQYSSKMWQGSREPHSQVARRYEYVCFGKHPTKFFSGDMGYHMIQQLIS